MNRQCRGQERSGKASEYIDMSNIHLSENILRLRREKGITQEELAKFIGVTKASVSKWETGLSMPDIMLLPQLATFFDVTVDEMLGYESQLGKEQIKAYYHSLAADFASKPFEEVMGKCEKLVKKYYSCYPFLMQMCVLWLNHFMMAETPERGQEILDAIAALCTHIMNQCKDIAICNNAVNMKAMVDLQSGKTEEVIESLADTVDVNRMEAKNSILVQAYLLTGNFGKADLVAQVSLYAGVMQSLSAGIQLLMIHGKDKARCKEIIRRMDALVDAFALTELHPNDVAGYQYQVALTLCGHQEEAEACERLEKYADAIKKLFEDGMALHGDAFFSRLDEWYSDLDLGGEGVRDRKLVEESALQVFSHPAIMAISDQERVEEIKKRVKKEIENA